MKTQKQIEDYLDKLIKYEEYINKNVPSGDCHWRINRAKIEMLQWVIYGE